MKRANELAAVHLLSSSYVLEVLRTVILGTKDAINQIQKRLDVLARILTNKSFTVPGFFQPKSC